MVYTKEEFKRLWEADDNGSGITYDDIAECAKDWGLFSNPRCHSLCDVTNAVLRAAGCEDAEPKERTMYVIKREDGTFYWRGNVSSQYGWKGFDEAALFNTRRGAESRMYTSKPLKCEIKKVKITLID